MKNSQQNRLNIFRTLLLAGLLFWGTSCQRQSLYPKTLDLSGYLNVHDPAIIKEDTTFYVFSTGGRKRGGILPVLNSKDLNEWTFCANVFDHLPDWINREIPGVKGIWAPDISYFNGQFHLYYSVSKFGKNDSAIGLVTNKTLNPQDPNYKWIDQGMVIRSRQDDNFNAIDANIIVENEESIWLCWGSFWDGIKMKQIDPKTGKPFPHETPLYSLARRPSSNAIEAPFIIKNNDYWYLFASFDYCCKGTNSTYKIMVGRSKNITGPYRDRNNKSMLNGAGTLVIQATTDNWKGPGHCSYLQDLSGDFLVFHAYHGNTGRSQLKISPVVWKNGWPQVAELP